MSEFLIPNPPATIEQMEVAVIDWRRAAAHERFRVEHNLCAGWTATATHNAELYEKTAREIEREIELRKSQDADAWRGIPAAAEAHKGAV